ncbi:MAG: InlB B-repeat-containing protein [Clostridiales bacterium]|nr:InlB B-repeat-containing protein [Clostridiales bacterium]
MTLAFIMVLCLLPSVAFAASSNSTVELRPSVGNTVTGVKVKVGEKIDGHSITSISGNVITVDLGKYQVNNDSFRLPYAKDIWYGVDDNKVDYISWAGGGSNRRSEGASALLVNGKNTAYYYFKGVPTYKTFELKYDANGGTGAPATQTHTATSQYEGSYNFTISTHKPTREDYDFKGWAESPTATTATRQPGGTIVVTGTTTLYAVWANHEHNDGDGDGYCDTDHECMHEKDRDGYCIVEGCTHPHEGDGACCPKKPDNKPDKPNPEPSATPAIDGLTGAEVVNVKCVTDGPGHEVKKYQLLTNSYEVGDVKGNAESGYTCDITVNPNKYVEAYNTDIGVNHTLAPVVQTGTIKLSWNGMDKKWELANPSGVPVEFTVECENQTPDKPNPPEPENTSEPFIELTGEKAVKVKCTTAGATHAEKSYGLKHDGYTIGEVKGDAESGYTCDITVNPDKYVEAYNEEIGVNHTLDPESQTRTITLKWKPDVSGDKIGEWVVASVIPVEFTVKCEDVNTYTVTYKDGVGGTAFKDQVHTGLKLGDATPGFTGTPYRWNYTFTGWKPAVAATVSGNAVYTAQWSYNGGGWTPSYPINPVPPVVVVPPKTGDMPFWYSIAQFLGLVK